MVSASKPRRQASQSSAGQKIRRRKFTGSLATPLLVENFYSTLLGHGKAEVVKLRANNCSELIGSAVAKLNLLFTHYGIARTGDDAQDYKTLAWSLALDFVPGFQLAAAEKSKRGRPRGNDLLYLWLLVDVEIIKRRKRRTGAPYSDVSALRELTTNSQSSPRWGRYKGRVRTLANLLARARDPTINPFVRIWERANPSEQSLMIKGFGFTKKDA